MGIDPYGAKQKIVAFCEVFCRGGRPCPPSKSGVFPWLFVGADAHLGAKSRALRGCASKLACGRRIGPLKCCEFASDFRKNGHFRRAARVVRPYGTKWQTNTDSPENHHKTGVFLRVDVGIDPYGVKNEKRCASSWPFVGADDSVRPRNSLNFRDPYGVKSNPCTKIIFPHC